MASIREILKSGDPVTITDVLMLHEKAINDLQKFEQTVYIAAGCMGILAVGAAIAKVLGL